MLMGDFYADNYYDWADENEGHRMASDGRNKWGGMRETVEGGLETF